MNFENLKVLSLLMLGFLIGVFFVAVLLIFSEGLSTSLKIADAKALVTFEGSTGAQEYPQGGSQDAQIR